MEVNFIGCGKLGKVIAKLMLQHKLIRVLGILNSNYASSLDAAQYLGEGKACSTYAELPQAQIYFITTPDFLIETTCSQLIKSKQNIPNGAIFVHCSGSVPSNALDAAKQCGGHVISIHPIKSFANPDLSVANFAGTYCGYEGDELAVPIIQALFSKLGAIVFKIDKESKSLYHAAGVLSNNYLVTLHYCAVKCYILSGVSPKIAAQLVNKLMLDALHNLSHLNHQQALTGPIQRGDVTTIVSHIQDLSIDKNLQDLYQALGKITLELTNHSQQVNDTLLNILSAQP